MTHQRRRLLPRLRTAACASAAVLAVCAGLGPSPAAAQPPLPVFPELPADLPAGSGIMRPCLEKLEGTVRCGRYRVWEDRDAKTGRTLDLAFVVAEALDPASRASDAVTYFHGGPGSALTPLAAMLIRYREPHRRKRDLLFLDFRGVGNSGALDCGVPYPGGVASRFETVFPADHIAACRDDLAAHARLDQYTSNRSMDDLDELRGWLNYTRLNLYGGSYGTREAQVFLRRHPESVRSMILTGVAPVYRQSYVTHARKLQRALDLLIAECAGNAACRAAYPDFGDTVRWALETVRVKPPTVEIDGETVTFGPGALGYALRGLLYQRGAEIPLLLHRVRATGDWRPLAEYYARRQSWVGDPEGQSGYHFSALCAEDIAPVTDEQVTEWTAGTFLADHLIAGYREACARWPHARLPAAYWQPVPSAVPTLLLSGERDPVTPPSGADEVARHLPNSLHVVVPNGGHGVGDDECVQQLMAEFLDRASVDGLDPSCIDARPPTEFALPVDEGATEETD